jgi:hypothetical protein
MTEREQMMAVGMAWAVASSLAVRFETGRVWLGFAVLAALISIETAIWFSR